MPRPRRVAPSHGRGPYTQTSVCTNGCLCEDVFVSVSSAALTPAAKAEIWTDLSSRAGTRGLASGRTLPVTPLLSSLFPDGGLRRGAVVSITGSLGLACLAVAAATRAGSWCAAVGLPELGPVAAAELGVDLTRFPFVPTPGRSWSTVVAVLADGCDVVLFRPERAVASGPDITRIAARIRQRGSVLVVAGSWPGAELRLEVERRRWSGLGAGHGHLATRRLEVTVEGRGVAARSRRFTVPIEGSPQDWVDGSAGVSTTVVCTGEPSPAPAAVS